jgi:hypothetical protein
MRYLDIIKALNLDVIVNGLKVTHDGGPDRLKERAELYAKYTGFIRVHHSTLGIKPLPVLVENMLSVQFEIVALRDNPNHDGFVYMCLQNMEPQELVALAELRGRILKLIETNEDLDTLLSEFQFTVI